jgi:hypothetical protein
VTNCVSPGRSVQSLTPRLPKNAPLRARIAWVLLLVAFPGCASLSCRSVPVMVVKKEERSRLETTPRGYSAETGRLEELRRPEIVRDYWVQDDEGGWHRVSFETYREAVVGRRMDVCK